MLKDQEYKWAARKLNLSYPYLFIFQGIVCVSVESLLQAFKFPSQEMQRRICLCDAKFAIEYARGRDSKWQRESIIHWKNFECHRDSEVYQYILDEVFKSVANNREFQENLLATGDRKLTYVSAGNNLKKTMATEDEICLRLIRVRTSLQNLRQSRNRNYPMDKKNLLP